MALALSRVLSQMTIASSPTTTRSFRSVASVASPKLSFSYSIGGRYSCWFKPRTFVGKLAFCSVTRSSLSAEKRHRQSEKRRLRNKQRKSEVKYRMRQVFRELGRWKKQKPTDTAELDPVEPLMQAAIKAIDKAVQKKALHRNTGARRKSRLDRARTRLLVQAGLMEPPEVPKQPSLVERYEARQLERKEAVIKLLAEQRQKLKELEQQAEV